MRITLTPSSRRNLAAIDLLRFACAIMMVGYHHGTAFVRHGEGGHRVLAEVAIPDGAMAWTWFGGTAAAIFFVVSGYVIFAAAEGATPLGVPGVRALRLVRAAWNCATTTPAVAAVVCACRFAGIGGRGRPRHLSS